MASILAISGSLRAGSYNTLLLRAAIRRAPQGTTVELGSIKDIPLYDGDVESASGVPEPVTVLKDRIAAADGLLLVTPEYNHSLPGVLKNAIDWLSRPASDIARVFGGRPTGVIGATPGAGGTALAQAAWLPVLRRLGALPFFGASMMLSRAGSAFDAEGLLVEAAAQAQLDKYMGAFAEFIARHAPKAT